jgi:hypothetical protein
MSRSDNVLQIFEAFSPLDAGVPMVVLGRDNNMHVGKRPFFTKHEELMKEEYYDEQAPEKKRRLTPKQMQMLEQSFKGENKLEPERKTELARRLAMTFAVELGTVEATNSERFGAFCSECEVG